MRNQPRIAVDKDALGILAMTNLQLVENMVQNDFVQADRRQVAWEANTSDKIGRERGVVVVEAVAYTLEERRSVKSYFSNCICGRSPVWEAACSVE